MEFQVRKVVGEELEQLLPKESDQARRRRLRALKCKCPYCGLTVHKNTIQIHVERWHAVEHAAHRRPLNSRMPRFAKEG